MAILDEMTEQEVSKNKSVRGYIIRYLGSGPRNSLLTRQIANAMVGQT